MIREFALSFHPRKRPIRSLLLILLGLPFFPPPLTAQTGTPQAPAAAPAPESPLAPSFATPVITLTNGELFPVLRTVATITPTTETLATLVLPSGGVVEALHVKDGDEITTGAPILKLDKKRFEEAIAKAAAAAAEASAGLKRALEGGLDAEQTRLDGEAAAAQGAADQAMKEADRQKGLADQKQVPEAAAAQARQVAETLSVAAKAAVVRSEEYRTAGRNARKAALEASAAQTTQTLQQTQKSLNSLDFLSPAAGKAARLRAAPGTDIAPGSVFGELVNDRLLVARADLPTTEGAKLAPGLKAHLGRSGVPPVETKILSLAAPPDPKTGAIAVDLRLPEISPGPRPGETFDLEIPSVIPSRGLVIPETALGSRGDKPIVRLVGPDQLIRPLEVRVIVRVDGRAIIEGEGLAEGAKIIADGKLEIPDGAKWQEPPAPSPK